MSTANTNDDGVERFKERGIPATSARVAAVFARMTSVNLPRVFLCERHDLGACVAGWVSLAQPCGGCRKPTNRYTTVQG